MAGNTLRLGGMALDPSVLPEVINNPVIAPDGRAFPDVRAELRRIPSFKNTWTVVWLYGQTIGILLLAARLHHPLTWLVAFLLMGRTHAQFASLMHESAHRTLFRHKGMNDWVGNWLLGYPVITSTPAYRRVHMAHHKKEFGPEEPDIPLYANYPISRDSLRRKLVRDLTGRTGIKLFMNQIKGFKSPDARVRHTLWRMVCVQIIIIAACVLTGYWWIYPVMWVLPYFTLWRVINRLRSIAEHGGLRSDNDRRITTHSVAQHMITNFYLVPYKIGYHLAHHVDAGIPFRNLPKYHQSLKDSHYITDRIEYPTYRALWKAVSSASA